MKKYNLLVPLSGRGQRMLDGGYTFPKPLLLVGNKHIIDWSMDSIDYSECQIIFVVRRDHINNFAIDDILRSNYKDSEIVVAEQDTQGSMCTCLLAEDLIKGKTPLIIYCPDIYFEPRFVPNKKHFDLDGFILTFKANSPKYSYVKVKDEIVTSTAEKEVISNLASVGIYIFRDGDTFLKYSKENLLTLTKTERYICPLYNDIIRDGGIVKHGSIEKIHVMGTPEELEFFKEVAYPLMKKRSFILCADHSGYRMKERVKDHLRGSTKDGSDIEFIDCGTYVEKDCDYIDYIQRAVELHNDIPGSVILGFCKTGQGINIAANRFPGIRAALVPSSYFAQYALRDNAANFFSIPSGDGIISPEELYGIIDILSKETFTGGRHQGRLMRIEEALVHI